MTTTQTTTTDRDILLKAFRLIRKAGIDARPNFMCCTGCATCEQKKGVPLVYWHRQDNESFGKDRNLRSDLHIGFCSDDGDTYGQFRAARVAVDSIVRAGMPAERVVWNSDLDTKILIKKGETDASAAGS